MLESQGVISAVNGGSFVVADAASPLNSSLRLMFTLDEHAAGSMTCSSCSSRILETEAAALAAARHGAPHLAEMDNAVDEMAASLAVNGAQRFIEADLRFHLAIAEATGNRLVLHCMHAVRDVVRRALTTVFVIPQSPESAVGEHRAIRAAIASGDPARARQKMTEHLVRVETDFGRQVSNG